ncbi:hypothetical protein M9H77_12482 [Catharanthus roseus]|uniref:Uncharacterized protein n=1 Tax=Catharanthus roseus TaxID=4058 RepID=A0ACC0BHP9_CATRO|nr:hypothetical protein M9H77_12482 [Catharanthus roseus]
MFLCKHHRSLMGMGFTLMLLRKLQAVKLQMLDFSILRGINSASADCTKYVIVALLCDEYTQVFCISGCVTQSTPQLRCLTVLGNEAKSVEIGVCCENGEADEEEDDLRELEDKDLDVDESKVFKTNPICDFKESGIDVDMLKELGSKGVACLTTIVKGDILTEGTKLGLESMTLKFEVCS